MDLRYLVIADFFCLKNTEVVLKYSFHRKVSSYLKKITTAPISVSTITTLR